MTENWDRRNEPPRSTTYACIRCPATAPREHPWLIPIGWSVLWQHHGPGFHLTKLNQERSPIFCPACTDELLEKP
jgi:DNA-directed RNA polymerase subunit RPC12/RpoP